MGPNCQERPPDPEEIENRPKVLHMQFPRKYKKIQRWGSTNLALEDTDTLAKNKTNILNIKKKSHPREHILMKKSTGYFSEEEKAGVLNRF